ncbi:MAG: C-GCAxxG-C-C family protein [Eubacteriales bacterium]|nr:C-GCAxxG-C-C family protein [Eubacteriales bacterium]
MSTEQALQGKAEKALTYFDGGCSCAQAVFTSFCGEMGLSEDAALKLSSSMGGGIAGMREVCGAFTGMCMALGALKGFVPPVDPAVKQRHYDMIQQKAERLTQAHGSLICRELLEHDAAHAQGLRATVCPRLVEACARFVAEELDAEA